MELPKLKIKKKKGNETFHYNNTEIKKSSLIDFWRWCCSDLMSNATRGIFAEYIVAMAIDKHKDVRNEWDAYDLVTKEGIKIEVKSSAYIQSWYQKDFSSIVFNVSGTKAWNPETNRYENDSKRQADVYVFALLEHRAYETVDPLNLNQWSFFVISRKKIDDDFAEAKTISLPRLRSINPIECSYKRLYQYIKREAI